MGGPDGPFGPRSTPICFCHCTLARTLERGPRGPIGPTSERNSHVSDITNRGESTPVSSQLDAFLAEIKQRTPAKTGTQGRLIFALDATASRQPTWDTACKLQAEMFQESPLSAVSICRWSTSAVLASAEPHAGYPSPEHSLRPTRRSY